MGEREHQLKTWPEPFEAMLDGRKTFEFRFDDRAFMVEDILTCREWDPAKGPALAPTGRWLRAKVTYVLHGGRFGLPVGYVVLGVRRISDGFAETGWPPFLTVEERAA